MTDDQAALERLILLYAQACDRRDGGIFERIFREDGLIEGQGFRMDGRAKIVSAVPTMLGEMYIKTAHQVHNILLDIQGDRATGEVYCTAHHISKAENGGWSDFVMVITYWDQYMKEAGRWYFKHRKLELEWTETRPVTAPGG